MAAWISPARIPAGTDSRAGTDTGDADLGNMGFGGTDLGSTDRASGSSRLMGRDLGELGPLTGLLH
jgi:hypothetical protein